MQIGRITGLQRRDTGDTVKSQFNDCITGLVPEFVEAAAFSTSTSRREKVPCCICFDQVNLSDDDNGNRGDESNNGDAFVPSLKML
jgi:hypothetical protein